MANITVRVRASRQGVRRLLRTLPAALSGRAADPLGAARSLSMRLGLTALALVKQAFIEKSEGRADESGLRWEPLAPSTIRSRRRGRGTGSPLIGRDTGVLLNTLSPGVPGNVLAVRPGLASVGTSCPYAAHFHATRPLWPEPRDWPQKWLAILSQQLVQGAAQAAVQMLRGAS
jgi:hypothetical protein